MAVNDCFLYTNVKKYIFNFKLELSFEILQMYIRLIIVCLYLYCPLEIQLSSWGGMGSHDPVYTHQIHVPIRRFLTLYVVFSFVFNVFRWLFALLFLTHRPNISFRVANRMWENEVWLFKRKKHEFIFLFIEYQLSWKSHI
jgi:hypothetical protein